MTARRSPSSGMSAPVDVLMVRMLNPEAPEGGGLVSVNLDEVLGAGQRQHGLHALLDTGQLQAAAGAADLPVQVHEAADRRAVDVGHRRQVDEDFTPARGDEVADRGGEVAEDWVHQPRLADADDR